MLMGLLPNMLCNENSKFRAKISKRDDAYLATMGLLPNRLCDENSKFRAKISKRDDAYLAKIRQGAVCNLQPKFRIFSRSLLGNSPTIRAGAV